MSESSFARTTLPRLGAPVSRLGVAGNYGLETADIHHAAERGVNFWFWSPSSKSVTPALKQILARERDQHVVAAMATTAYTARGVRANVEKARRSLDTDQIDLYLLGWLGKASRFTPAIQDALVDMRDKGLVKAVGTSIHDRQRAGELARESVLDALMIRYNAKHPGAEQDIFPHLAARDPIVISYTTTSWQQLLKPIKGIEGLPAWPGPDPGVPLPPLTPALCYRFALGSPHVHVTLTAPKDRAQLDANLDVLESGPLSAEEDAWVRAYGRAVKARKKLPFV